MQGSVHNSFPSTHRESEANWRNISTTAFFLIPLLLLQRHQPISSQREANVHSVTPNFHVMHNKMFKCHTGTVELWMNCLIYTVYVALLFCFFLRAAPLYAV